jgi:diguanylate cyclase (GGDEF)-like protein
VRNGRLPKAAASADVRAGSAEGAQSAALVATEREEIERRLAQHGRQHDAVARLGQTALRQCDLGILMNEVVHTVQETLGVELCGVLKLRDAEEMLDVVASVGYPRPPSGLPAGTGSQAGYTLKTREPVVSADLRSETRFDAKLLLEKGLLSGMTTVIEGNERPFGVLSAFTVERRPFAQDDVNFLVAVANLVSAAVERERKEDAARHAAMHDALTGLPNRTLALDRIDRVLARRRRAGTGVAVLLLDIDRFKLINDSLGHEAGDDVLRTLGGRLQETVRASDTIARLSGDEFVVVCECAGVRPAVELAERILAAFSRPVALLSGEHVLSASIGIAVAKRGDETSASLLRDADTAMYRAKERGPGRYELFDAAVRAEVLSRLHTETELRRALERDELSVHYQPIVDAASGRPVAIEALARWARPDHGLVLPLDFIPIAEETGLILELGRHVLEAACTQGAAWQRRYDAPLQMFVNVSGRQLADPRFPAEVRETAMGSGLLEGTLGLEVTESVLIRDGDSSMAALGELHAAGVKLMLDDFGTGYSSLGHIRRFPLSGVKVDRLFVDDLGDKADDAIMRAIVEMSRALGLTVVAEGVESEAQLDQLRRLRCERVQGRLLCPPMAAGDLGEFLDARLARSAETALRTALSPPSLWPAPH